VAGRDGVSADRLVLGILGALALAVLLLGRGVAEALFAGGASAGDAPGGGVFADGRGQFFGTLLAAFLALLAAIFGWYARRFETRLTVAEALLVELRRKRGKMAGAFTEAQRTLYLALLRGERHPDGQSESPFTPIDEPGDRIFDAYLKELPLLPYELVEALVAFYDRERDIEAFLRQTNERPFRGLRAERQMQMWEAFFVAMPADYDALAARAEAMLSGYVAAVRRSPLRIIVRDRRPAGWDPSSG
jgi:hypothetical protein